MKSLSNTKFAVLLDRLVEQFGEEESVQYFIETLTKMNATHRVERILQLYTEMIAERSSIIVESASELDSNLIVDIEKAFGKKISEVKIDKALIGGVKVQSSSEIYDITVSAVLNNLKRNLNN